MLLHLRKGLFALSNQFTFVGFRPLYRGLVFRSKLLLTFHVPFKHILALLFQDPLQTARFLSFSGCICLCIHQLAAHPLQILILLELNRFKAGVENCAESAARD